MTTLTNIQHVSNLTVPIIVIITCPQIFRFIFQTVSTFHEHDYSTILKSGTDDNHNHNNPLEQPKGWLWFIRRVNPYSIYIYIYIQSETEKERKREREREREEPKTSIFAICAVHVLLGAMGVPCFGPAPQAALALPDELEAVNYVPGTVVSEQITTPPPWDHGPWPK